MGYLSKKQLADSFRLYGFGFNDSMGLVNNLEIPYYEKIQLMKDYVTNRKKCISDALLLKWHKNHKERFWRYGSKEKET